MPKKESRAVYAGQYAGMLFPQHLFSSLQRSLVYILRRLVLPPGPAALTPGCSRWSSPRNASSQTLSLFHERLPAHLIGRLMPVPRVETVSSFNMHR
ncbi:hypothetical protein GQ44DRAFT_719937 [Phaeosphaeriaceae sp. PMI808]|nr:hypothetical protein GQ44DRAFT_719937 [Phaeosphaeriaceae sp. PMI808]